MTPYEKQCVEQAMTCLRADDTAGALAKLEAAFQPPPRGALWLLDIARCASKLEAIKSVRALTGLGLIEAKNLVERLPQPLGDVDETNVEVQWLRNCGAILERR